MRLSYRELKLSWEIFSKAPTALSTSERVRLRQIAGRQECIEEQILASSEAADVVVPGSTLQTRLNEIRARYPKRDELARDLKQVGLDETALAATVERELLVETLLERVASRALPASAVDAEIYYHLNRQVFEQPARRRLRHILITFDDVKARTVVRAQLEALRERLQTAPAVEPADPFDAAALRHSQCPSALEGGRLGVVRRGQLYPQLDAPAFALAEGELSTILESPVGLHLLRCDEILASGLLPFAEVRQPIIERLNDRKRQLAQREWIKSLFAKER